MYLFLNSTHSKLMVSPASLINAEKKTCNLCRLQVNIEVYRMLCFKLLVV